MTYEEFKDALVEKVNVRLEGSSIKAELKAVTKNNNVVKEGLVFIESGSNASPVIYFEGAYLWYQENENMGAVVDRVLNLLNEKVAIDINSIIGTWQEAKERVGTRMINYEWNKEILSGVLHKRFLDLAIVPVLISDVGADKRSGTTYISEYFLQSWGIDEATLWEMVYHNLKKGEFEYKGLIEILKDTFGEVNMAFEEKYRMYYLGNKERTYGATAMLRTDLMESFADEIGGNFYIIPSSIHELLLLPDYGMNEKDDAGMKEVIETANNQEVIEEERLSFHLYYYDRENKEIIIK